MNYNKGGKDMLRHTARTTKKYRRRPIGITTKSKMVAKLESRGWLTSIHTNDSALVCFMKDNKTKV